MMLRKNFVTIAIALKLSCAFGNKVGSGQHKFQESTRAHHAMQESNEHVEDVAYDSTVTTEMNYYTSDSASSNGKGKGKGGHHYAEYEYVPGDAHHHENDNEYESGKGAKKGDYHGYEFTHSPTSLEHGYMYGKGKGKGYHEAKHSKSSKGGKKSSKKGGPALTHAPHSAPPVHTPTHAPNPSGDYGSGDYGSGDYGTTRPPTPISAPTRPPSETPPASDTFTASPTDAGSIAFNLEPFSLLYETQTSRQASRSELLEVTDATRLYLENFMFDEFSQSAFTFLDDFVTRLITSTFVMGAPYVVDYSATARFNPFSTVFPGEEQLNEALVIAFTAPNLDEYISILGELPSNNVFRGANVFFGEPVVRISRKSSNNAATIAAATIAATLLAAGAVIYKRRSTSELMEGKDLTKSSGDATVAGETYACETCDGTASVDAGSVDHFSRYNEDDDEANVGAKNRIKLGTIEEGDDDDSLRPAWRSSPSYDDKTEFHEEEINFEDEFDPNETDKNGRKNSVNHSSRSLYRANSIPAIRRVATVGSSTASPSISSDYMSSAASSFDEMALQGMGNTDLSSMPDVDDDRSTSSEESCLEDDDEFESKAKLSKAATPDIVSVLSNVIHDEQSVAKSVISSSSSTPCSRRPRTVDEIEAMLKSETAADDEESQAFAVRTRSFGNDSFSRGASKRPRTVEEIESLLSLGIDDEDDEGTSGHKLD